ncbi:ABC transporter permease [Rhizobium setariae]|nr:ABC transporter permease [Rhizobium setariae]
MSLRAQIGLLIVTLNVLIAVFVPVLAPYSESEIVGNAWSPASAQHWLGLDNLGRDVLSRLLYGARLSIGLSLIITTLSFSMGVFTGFAAAVLGKWADVALSRIVDLLLSMPALIFAMVVLSVMGTDLIVLIVTISILDATRIFRVSRALAMNIASLEYVEAAHMRGEGLWWIVRREILPNSLPPLVAEFGLRFCFTFLFISALSFLGLGIQPPFADWGSMVKDYSQLIMLGVPAVFYPAGAIALLTIGINLLVDWLVSTQTQVNRGA